MKKGGAHNQRRQGASAPRRRLVVGVVSLTLGIGAVVGLSLMQDRMRTLREEQRCRSGDARTCLRLEATYRVGKRVSRNDDVADDLHRQAVAIYRGGCDNHDADACFQLGVVSTEAALHLRDPKTASSSFARACRAGLKRACVSR